MVRVMDGACRTAKIIDLGLAKTAMNESAAQAAISTPGSFAGTPEFASPEQFAGVQVDIRSDLYSLGVTLWEMLLGRVPFRGSPSELMYQHQHAPLPLEQLKDVPQSFAVLLERLLQKDPAKRPQSPAELQALLRTLTVDLQREDQAGKRSLSTADEERNRSQWRARRGALRLSPFCSLRRLGLYTGLFRNLSRLPLTPSP